MKVSPICRKDQPDKDGLCKIYIRINDKFNRSYVATDIKVLPRQFEKGKVVKHPKADKLNSEIRNLIIRHESDPQVNRDTIKAFTEKYIEECKVNKWAIQDTIDFYQSQLNKFLEYSGDIQLTRINEEVLKSYNAFLVARGNENNTRWNSFKFLKKICNVAGIKPNPVSEWKGRPKYRQTERTWLTQSEVRKIVKEAEKMSDRNPLKKVAQWFLLQCHIGVAVADLRKIKAKEIIDASRLVTHRTKTGELTTVPLTKEIERLLHLAGPLTISDQDYNRNLKLLAALCGIDKNLSSHVARHTFGVRLAELKVSTEVIAKLMGHRKLSTTAIYTQIQNARVDEEFKGFGY